MTYKCNGVLLLAVCISSVTVLKYQFKVLGLYYSIFIFTPTKTVSIYKTWIEDVSWTTKDSFLTFSSISQAIMHGS